MASAPRNSPISQSRVDLHAPENPRKSTSTDYALSGIVYPPDPSLVDEKLKKLCLETYD